MSGGEGECGQQIDVGLSLTSPSLPRAAHIVLLSVLSCTGLKRKPKFSMISVKKRFDCVLCMRKVSLSKFSCGKRCDKRQFSMEENLIEIFRFQLVRIRDYPN